MEPSVRQGVKKIIKNVVDPIARSARHRDRDWDWVWGIWNLTTRNSYVLVGLWGLCVRVCVWGILQPTF